MCSIASVIARPSSTAAVFLPRHIDCLVVDAHTTFVERGHDIKGVFDAVCARVGILALALGFCSSTPPSPAFSLRAATPRLLRRGARVRRSSQRARLGAR